MSLTQEQANAIAEREFPKPKRGAYSDTAEGLECFWDDVELIDRDRRVYAKCLMDLNPLIEAGEKMRGSHSLLVAFAAAHLPVQHLDNLVDTSAHRLSFWHSVVCPSDSAHSRQY